jgi:hypothetical protein
MPVRLRAVRFVPVAVVEGCEDDAFADPADAGSRLEAAARGLDAHEVALLDPHALGVGRRELHPDLRRGRVQLARACGLRAGVEVVGGAAGGEQEWVVVARRLVRRQVVAGLEDRAAVGAELCVVFALVACARQQIVSVVLAVVGGRVEAAVGVQALRPVRLFLGARPLDAAAAAQLVV